MASSVWLANGYFRNKSRKVVGSGRVDSDENKDCRKEARRPFITLLLLYWKKKADLVKTGPVWKRSLKSRRCTFRPRLVGVFINRRRIVLFCSMDVGGGWSITWNGTGPGLFLYCKETVPYKSSLSKTTLQSVSVLQIRLGNQHVQPYAASLKGTFPFYLFFQFRRL